MLTLPSGIIVTLSAVPFDSPVDAERATLRRHVLATAREPFDLFPLIQVAQVGPPQKIESPEEKLSLLDPTPEHEGLVPRATGLSLIAFNEQLDEADKIAFGAWVNSDRVRNWMDMQLQEIVLQRYRQPTPWIYRDLRPETDTLVPLYYPGDLAISCAGLFPKEADDWASYTSDQGYLRIRPRLMLHESGAFGTLGLGNPPSPTELDAWEGSKAADVWDYYGFLAFALFPAEGLGKRELLIFFKRETFFDRPLEIVLRLPLADETSDGADGSDDDQQILRSDWRRVMATLAKHVRVDSLANQTWTVQGRVYTSQDPDG